MDKYLIVGLGNVGDDYVLTRHNIGFMVLDAFAKASNIVFSDRRYGFVAETSLKGRKVLLLKPSTFMNLSGNAVRYWLNKENIDQARLLVVSDDVALPLGQFRLKASGSNGGHNGLGHIQQLIGQNYARLRMGIGNDYPVGRQVDWVLGRYDDEELDGLQPAIDTAVEIIRSFVLAGIDITINQYNKLGKGRPQAAPSANSHEPHEPQKPEEPCPMKQELTSGFGQPASSRHAPSPPTPARTVAWR